MTGSKYMKQTLIEIEEEIDNLTIIVGDFNISLSIMYGAITQKINKINKEIETQ